MTLAEQFRQFHAIVTGEVAAADGSALVEGDAAERLGIYVHAYTARIAGVLVADYPKLETLRPLGPLVADYLRAYPSRHPSLREVGANLGAFLAARGEPAHLVELAALERARVESFDGGRDAHPLGRDELEALGPAAFPNVQLQLVPSARLVGLTTNADDLWDAIESGERVPDAARSSDARTVLVWRRDVTVIHRTLAADETPLVQLLASGAAFGDLCELLAGADEPIARALELLLKWLDGGILDRDVALASAAG